MNTIGKLLALTKLCFNMFTHSSPKFSRVRRIPDALTLFAFAISLALLGGLAGCHEDNIFPKEKKMPRKDPGPAQLLVSGLQGTSGSTIGPGGALYVAEGAVGKITRINPKTGEVTTFASGLPPLLPSIGIGGAYDIAFLGSTAYVLVTLVGTDIGGSNVVGIYRVDGPDSYTIIADIGAFSIANPPNTDFFVPSGVQYAIQAYRGAFLVTDGHHNRVLHVTRDGEISEFKTFGNIVPTGLAVWGNTIYMAQAGAIPHNPEDGKVVSFGPKSRTVRTVASGARLLVDVEFNRGRTLFALSQGIWDGVAEGSPAAPDTGSLVRVNKDGTFTVITEGLDH
jgi:hypothetical protein